LTSAWLRIRRQRSAAFDYFAVWQVFEELGNSAKRTDCLVTAAPAQVILQLVEGIFAGFKDHGLS
jgi:hypothetical protein